jgi:MFS family permease
MLGALSCISIGDILGRIKMIILGSAITVVGLVTMCSSYSLGQLIAARVITGLGVGAVVATVPAWQAECSPADHRGALVVLEGFFATVGLAASQFVDLGCFFSKTSLSWRLPLAVPLICSITMLVMAPFLPESPRWLVKKGRVDEARKILEVFNDTDDSSTHIEEDIQAMQRSLQIMGGGSFSGLLRDKGNMIKLRTALAMFSTFSQQMNGAGRMCLPQRHSLCMPLLTTQTQ